MTNNSNQPKHTQGEWKVIPFGEWNTEMIVDKNECPIARLRFEDGTPFESPDGKFVRTTAETEANAQRIVKAVNMHDELIHRLKEVLYELETKEENKERNSKALLIANIELTLKQAEGK